MAGNIAVVSLEKFIIAMEEIMADEVTGAAAGSALGPWGMVGGAAFGAGLGLYNAFKGNEAAEREAARKRALLDDYKRNLLQASGLYENEMGHNIAAYDQRSSRFLNTPQGVEAWLNPNMDYQLRQAAKANDQQYAAGGKMLSGAAMKGLQDRSQNIAKLSWNDAFNMMNASNNQGLSDLQFGTDMRNDLASNKFNNNADMQNNMLTAQLGIAAPERQSLLNSALQSGSSAVDLYGKIRNAFRS